jgi:hypothetical protein
MIKKVEVNRDSDGFWTHPDLPDWGETISRSEFEAWEAENQIKTKFVYMDGDAEQSFVDEWFEDGICDCSPWIPTFPSDSAFLLSIHDTEDAPVAIFAEPLTE